MIGLLGYSFLGDINAADPFPSNVVGITNTTIKNGIFDHVNISKNTTFDYTAEIPDGWDFDTILDANLDGNINGGNVDEIIGGITLVKIKRRAKGDFDWTTIKEVHVSSAFDLSFVFTDNLNLNDTQYEYAWVPVIGDVEGDYITNEVYSTFRGVFICDIDTVYKFFSGVKYGTTNRVQQVGVFTPYGRQYPVVVSNGLVNYNTGSMSGRILPDGYEEGKNHDLSSSMMTAKSKLLMNFLTNKKPKIVKDYLNNSWLCFITGSPSLSYDNYGLGMMDASFNWTEIGDVRSRTDLYNAGLIPSED